MAVITVLGAGMMGSALCMPLVDAGNEVRLVGSPLEEGLIAALQRGGRHPGLKCSLPAGLKVSQFDGFEKAMVGCELLALGVSSAGVRWAAETIANGVRAHLPVFMISKGLAWTGGKLQVLPDVVRAALPPERAVHPAAIAGPCIAGELARRVPSCVVLTGRTQVALDRIAAAIRTDYYHVWTSTDVVGIEVCAALKNAYAMAVAFGSGVHEKNGGEPGSVAMHNYESAIFAQSIFEMGRIVEHLGGERASVSGLAGAGDLDVTNNGGRTGRFGRWIGLGLTVDDAVAKMEGATLECIEIITQMRHAMRAWAAAGEMDAGALPLMGHMAEVVLDGAPVDVPFARFFGG